MRKRRGMVFYPWQHAGSRVARLRDVLSTAAVLLVHKLLSSLPYCATPCVAKTSRGFPLVSLLYISKQSTERITTWSEVEIIARASIASLCFM